MVSILLQVSSLFRHIVLDDSFFFLLPTGESNSPVGRFRSVQEPGLAAPASSFFVFLDSSTDSSVWVGLLPATFLFLETSFSSSQTATVASFPSGSPAVAAMTFSPAIPLDATFDLAF